MVLVALHTQALGPKHAGAYIALLERGLRAARLNNAFPDRRRLQGTLSALDQAMQRGIYEQLYVDSRTGLPNMASYTRVLTDQEIAAGSLARMGEHEDLSRRRDEAEVFARLASKHEYFTWLKGIELAPVDLHRVLLRRHDPMTGAASFRMELTKLDGSGLYMQLTIELTQIASVWRRRVIDLDKDGESAAASQAIHAMIYRCAALDAETIFVRLHGIEGVSVERVQRGVIGPVLFALPDGVELARTLEPEGPLGDAWQAWITGPGARTSTPEMAATFATDIAAVDVREEKSNDPLSPLLTERIAPAERARYEEIRRRYPFKVFKDRKFIGTAGVRGLMQAVIDASRCRNLIYDLR
ncbi:MAG: hypothetical protein IPK80_12255 [Nannocystis sp.]|nr:hypothetical protein [Nannocystis sp.]